MTKIEHIILKNLFVNETFIRSKALPHLKVELFTDRSEQFLFEELLKFISTYNQTPSQEALFISLNNRTDLNEQQLEDAVSLLTEITKDKTVSDDKWLMVEAEKFCQERSIHNAMLESIRIMDGSDANKNKGMIPKLLSDALAVSFDSNIGHDYFEDAESRYEFFHHTEQKIPFDLEFFNKITNNGLANKTLTIIMAGVNVGKSMFMCHHAAACLAQNYNVLYITLEMAEERIAKRIDANLLNTNLSELDGFSKEQYQHKLVRLREKVKGKLIIKEFPTASAGSNHFKALLDELMLKKRFRPHIIFIDYINLCTSARIKLGSSVNSYTYIKTISEELRGLAVEFNLPVVSATQINRSGYTSSDPGMEDTSESFGLPATVDFMFALVTNEDFDAKKQIMVKQLKNRDEDVTINRKFMIGVDRAKMKFFDVKEQSQRVIFETGQPNAESLGIQVDYDTVEDINKRYAQKNNLKV